MFFGVKSSKGVGLFLMLCNCLTTALLSNTLIAENTTTLLQRYLAMIEDINPKQLSVADITLCKSKTYTISESNPNGTYASAANLKLTSINTKVATVTKGNANKSIIKAVAKDTAYIKITLYNGKTAQCKVTIKQEPT